MNMKQSIKHFILLTAIPAYSTGIPVFDASALLKAEEELATLRAQYVQIQQQIKRMGDPVAVDLRAASGLMRSLNAPGVGRTLEEIRSAADGRNAVFYDGSGLYRPPGEFVTTADGLQVARNTNAYRKFDAVIQAKITHEDVMRDTQERRQQLHQQIKDTLAALQLASTLAETHKLVGVLSAQNAELSAIDREREAALSRILVQQIENQNDAARQALADREDRVAAFQTARKRLGQIVLPDTTPVHIPDPRNRRP